MVLRVSALSPSVCRSSPASRCSSVTLAVRLVPHHRRSPSRRRTSCTRVTSSSFYINDNGDKVYTTKKESPLGLVTQSAHPARFSPDDKYSRQRVLLKKRFGLLPTQQPPPKY
ncbi:unnamed protein product [Citrullus colocynthis]|uniref:Nucleolar protein 10 n=1 Tax=Citrullus colocynthis TaxID=252529 RepID=A0ABP0YSR1_9ROSI